MIGGDGNSSGVPTLKKDVKVMTGAKLIGPIIIGAGAVVICDAPPNCLAVRVSA